MDAREQKHEHERENEHAAPTFRHPPSRCPYCHDDCGEDDDVAVCRRCLARHHAECWNAASACGTCKGERVLIEIALRPDGKRAYREWVVAVAREPRWLRLILGVLFLVVLLGTLLFGAFIIYRAFVAPFQGLAEWLLLLPFCLFMFSAFPSWVCWRAARLRLWPPALEPAPANATITPKDKAAD